MYKAVSYSKYLNINVYISLEGTHKIGKERWEGSEDLEERKCKLDLIQHFIL